MRCGRALHGAVMDIPGRAIDDLSVLCTSRPMRHMFARTALFDAEAHLGRLDEDLDRDAFGEAEVVHRVAGDGGGDLVAAGEPDANDGHRLSSGHRDHRAVELIARAQSHERQV